MFSMFSRTLSFAIVVAAAAAIANPALADDPGPASGSVAIAPEEDVSFERLPGVSTPRLEEKISRDEAREGTPVRSAQDVPSPDPIREEDRWDRLLDAGG